MQYDDFFLRLYKSNAHPARYQAQVLVPDSADGGRFDLPLTANDLNCLRDQANALRKYAEYGPTLRYGLNHTLIDDLVRSITDNLHNSLPAPLRDSIRISLQRALESGRGLRIGILIEPSAAELAALPWEMLRDPVWSTPYLAQTSAVSILRLENTSLPIPPRIGAQEPTRDNNGRKFSFGIPLQPQRPKRVLIALIGASKELMVAGAYKEAQLIEESLPPDTIVDIIGPPTTLSILQAKLNSQPYQLFHIITHGHVDHAMSLAYLLFDAPGSPGTPDEVVGARLRNVLHNQPALELIVLSACRSAAPARESTRTTKRSRSGKERPFHATSLSAQIVSGLAIPAIAMQFDIVAPEDAWADDKTHSWAGAFYTQLGREKGIEYALVAARQALTLDNDPVLWAAPVVFVPFYWETPPAPIFQRLDHYLYQRLAALMEGNGQVLLEVVLIAGLLLIAGFVMSGLLTPPADVSDSGGIFGMAYSLFSTLVILPAVISGSVIVLAARHQPLLRILRGRDAFAVLRTAYAGAGLGMFIALGVVGMLALVLRYVTSANVLLRDLLTPFLQLISIVGVVLQEWCSLVAMSGLGVRWQMRIKSMTWEC